MHLQSSHLIYIGRIHPLIMCRELLFYPLQGNLATCSRAKHIKQFIQKDVTYEKGLLDLEGQVKSHTGWLLDGSGDASTVLGMWCCQIC